MMRSRSSVWQRLRHVGIHPLRAALAVVALALIASWSACSSSTSPAPAGSSPSLVSPALDAVVKAPIVLVVQNVTGQTGTRTYDFQVADSAAGLDGPASGLAFSATGIPEGAGGQTQDTVSASLPSGRQFFWRSRAVTSGTAGAWSDTFRFVTDVSNSPPVIQSLTPASDRAEVGSQVALSAVVTDQETPVGSLTFNWTASAGTITANGANATWQAPSTSAPTAATVVLTVVEHYTVTLAGGKTVDAQNQVSATTTIHVNDSTAEITNLVLTFLDDFVHSDRTPEFCVRNFSDSCPGKQAELSDIEGDQAQFTNDPTRSGFNVASINFSPANQPTFASIVAPCHFAATNKSTGVFGIATGVCNLTAVYENFNWFLCDSHFTASSSSSSMRSFRF